jgi:hypothetical protein
MIRVNKKPGASQGQRSRQTRMERRRAARVAAQRDTPVSGVTMTSAGKGEVPEPRFPHGMRNAATTYASSTSTDVAAYEDLPVHHLLAVRNLIATTNEESYHGSASELPPRPRTGTRSGTSWVYRTR